MSSHTLRLISIWATLLLADIMALSIRAEGASAVGASRACFDFAHYRTANPDLAGESEDGLWKHWTNAGFGEGRSSRSRCGADGELLLEEGEAVALELGLQQEEKQQQGQGVQPEGQAQQQVQPGDQAAPKEQQEQPQEPQPQEQQQPQGQQEQPQEARPQEQQQPQEQQEQQPQEQPLPAEGAQEGQGPYQQLRPPNSPGARAWLDAFLEGRRRRPPAKLPSAGTTPWLGTKCGQPVVGRRPRRSLIIAAVGDEWVPQTWWLQLPEAASFDVAALYYGQEKGWECPLCVLSLRRQGTFYHILHELFRFEPPELAAVLGGGYDYVALLDEFIAMPTCDLNAYFETLAQYSVVMGQPSTCPGDAPAVPNANFYQDADHVLRFTSIVDLAATTFDAGFFRAVVRHTFTADTFSGWGLEQLWPLLLHNDARAIATVDAVCMVNTQPGAPAIRSKATPLSLARLPRTPEEERALVRERYGISDAMFVAQLLGGVPTAAAARRDNRGSLSAAASWLQAAALVAMSSLLLIWTARRRRQQGGLGFMKRRRAA